MRSISVATFVIILDTAAISQPVDLGPQVGRRQLSMGLQSSHFSKFYYKTV